MLRTAVPKAPVDEDCKAPLWKHNVRGPWEQLPAVDAIAETLAVKRAAKD